MFIHCKFIIFKCKACISLHATLTGTIIALSMSNYSKLTFIQNKHRQSTLREFRDLIDNYFKNIDFDFDRDIIDTEESRKTRQSINKKIDGVDKVMGDAECSAIILHTAPPMLGGRQQRLNILQNVFNMQNYDIPVQTLIDFIDQASGVYEADFWRSVVRTFNPFFWLIRLIDFMTGAPFRLVEKVSGKSQTKAESSVLGRLIKVFIGIISLLVTFGGLWQAGQYIGLIPENITLLELIQGR